jgi:hypothetical protein
MNAVRAILEPDHRRLEALLDRACEDPDAIGRASYDAFREGLLRHIAIEEKVLLAEAKRLRGGEPLAAAAQLRLDHAAIAALLAVRPTAETVRELRALLAVHNTLEEGEEGVYAECERLSGDGLADLIERMRAVPPARVAEYASPVRLRAQLRRAIDAAWAARGAARAGA